MKKAKKPVVCCELPAQWTMTIETDLFLEFLKGIGVDPTYIRKIVPRVEWMGTPYVDVYAVIEAYGERCPAVQHALKKLLCAGQRGVKSRLQDLKEAKAAIERAIQMEERR